MPRNKSLLIVILLVVLSISGCWDRQEVDMITFPFALGIAKNPQGEGVEIFAQVAETQSGAPGGIVTTQFKVLQSTGETVGRAISNLEAKSQQTISMHHVKSVVVSEDMAKSGLREVYDILGRFQEFRYSSYLLVSSSDIGKMFQINPTLQIALPTPFQAVQLIRNNTSEVVDTTVRDFFMQILTLGSNPVEGRVELVGNGDKPDLLFSGAAAFNKDKMVGWLSKSETSGWLFIKARVGHNNILAPCPGHEDKKLSFNTLSSDSEITPVMEDNQLKMKVKIKLDVALQEETCLIPVNADNVNKMQNSLNQSLKREVEEVINKAQKEWRTDIFGFGEKVRRKYRHYWKENKDQWNDRFADLSVEVQFKSRIKRADKTKDSIAFPENRGR